MTEAIKSNKNVGGRYFAPKPKKVACPYSVGQKVVHVTYGKGVITKLNHSKVTIVFYAEPRNVEKVMALDVLLKGKLVKSWDTAMEQSRARKFTRVPAKD